MTAFSHLSGCGEASMVDTGAKPLQKRRARATALLECQRETIRLLRQQALPKGDVLAVARIAGIQAAKKTADLIPLCHSLALDHVAVDFEVGDDRIRILTEVGTVSRTGVEMEALAAATIGALALYDMMKAVDKSICISGIRVVEKIKE